MRGRDYIDYCELLRLKYANWLTVVERSKTTIKKKKRRKKEGQPSLIIYYCTYLSVIAIRIAEVLFSQDHFFDDSAEKKTTKKNVNKVRFVYY